MSDDSIGFGARLILAFLLPWKIIFNGVLAARVQVAIGMSADISALNAPTVESLEKAVKDAEAASKAKADAEISAAQAILEQTKAKAAAEIEDNKLRIQTYKAEAEARVEKEIQAARQQRDEELAAAKVKSEAATRDALAAKEAAEKKFKEIYDEAITSKEDSSDHAALQLLAILQREGRLLDFLQEDVASFSDSDVGAAARVVHEGCKRAIGSVLTIEAVRTEDEGSTIVLSEGFNAVQNRITGNVVGKPPFRGTLAHHGWKVSSINLPTLNAGADPSILAPAEIEL